LSMIYIFFIVWEILVRIRIIIFNNLPNRFAEWW
jgi:hypothetical protein